MHWIPHCLLLFRNWTPPDLPAVQAILAENARALAEVDQQKAIMELRGDP